MNKEKIRNGNINFAVWIRYYKIPTLTVLLVVVLGFLGWGHISELLEENRKLTDQRTQLDQLNRKVNYLRSVEENGFEKSDKLIARALPNEKPVFVTLDTLQGVASDSGVVIKSLSTSPGSLATMSASTEKMEAKSVPKLKVKTLQIEIKVQGELDAINDFILRIARVVPLMDVTDVKISAAKKAVKTEEKVAFNSDLRIDVYWMPPEKIKSEDKSDSYMKKTDMVETVTNELRQYQYYGME